MADLSPTPQDDGWLNLYPQSSHHMDAKIIGTRGGFKSLAKAMFDAAEVGSAEIYLFAGDGEGYDLTVQCVNDASAMPDPFYADFHQPRHVPSEKALHADERAELERLRGLINSPEIHDFVAAVQREAIHQRERWGSEHDEGKSPEDWLWLIAYLSTKATQASRYKDTEKYLHHIVTCAAACLNWHANATGKDTGMRPGVRLA